MKQYYLLPDQTVQALPRGEHVLSFSDAEDMINDNELMEPKDDLVDAELVTADRKNKKEIKVLENEIGRWQVLVDSVTGINPPDFDNQTLAILRGRLVRYLMRSREVRSKIECFHAYYYVFLYIKHFKNHYDESHSVFSLVDKRGTLHEGSYR